MGLTLHGVGPGRHSQHAPQWEKALKGKRLFPAAGHLEGPQGDVRMEVTAVQATEPARLGVPRRPEGYQKFDLGSMMGGAFPGGFPGLKPGGNN